MDPAGSIALTYLTYSVSALDELLTFDADGEIDYRAAESYEVNEDSTVWTFHLREEAVWSDGTPVTSADFLNTMTRALDPKSGSGYANYLFPIRNAEAIYNGEMESGELGVETPDDDTLIFYLEKPCVYFLESAAASGLYAVLQYLCKRNRKRLGYRSKDKCIERSVLSCGICTGTVYDA